MGAVTYPDPTVIEFVSRRFVAYQVNTKRPTAEDRSLLTAHRLLWEPGFAFLDCGARELRRTVGFLPPAEFLAELRLVLGKAALLHARPYEALAWFEAASAGATAVAPEALYWAGIAAYRVERDLRVLRERWGLIRQRFPDSTWWTRAEVLDEPRAGDPEDGGSSPIRRIGWREIWKFLVQSQRVLPYPWDRP